MSAGTRKESTQSRGGTAWNDGLYSFDGAGTSDGGGTQAQDASSGAGGADRGDEGGIPKAAWFAPVTECKDGVCPVPWTTPPEGTKFTLKERPVLQEDTVNHPSHYTDGGIECIEAIEAALTFDEFRGYCKGNCIKYIWRERLKGGTESLKKARWYLDRLIDIDEN